MSAVPSIREIRAKSGLSQAAFAEKYWIPKRSVEDWEADKRHCPIYLRRLLAISEGAMKKTEKKDPD